MGRATQLLLGSEEQIANLADEISNLSHQDARRQPKISKHYEDLEKLRRKTLELGHKRRANVIGRTPRSHDESSQINQAYSRAMQNLAKSYMALAMRIEKDGSNSREDESYLKRACFHAISCLSEQLVDTYARYQELPSGIWYQIHQIYAFAQSEGVAAQLIREETAVRSVQAAYIRAVLLGISDPFNLPFRGVARVYKHLEDWVEHASLQSRPETPENEKCMFVIDPTSDRPALPALKSTRLRAEYNECWLNTRSLVLFLNGELNRESRRIQETEPGTDVFEQLDNVELFRSLIVRWGLHPVRNDKRTRAFAKCEIVVGLRNVDEVLRRAMSAADEIEYSQDSFNMVRGTFGYQQKLAQPDFKIWKDWELVDRSNMGFKLRAKSAKDLKLLVGEIMAVRFENSSNWTTCSVEWIVDQAPNGLVVGIRKFGASVHPAKLFQMELGEIRNSAPSPTLLMIERSEQNTNMSLLCDRGMYHPSTKYLVKVADGKRDLVVRPVRLTRSTRAFTMFQASRPLT